MLKAESLPPDAAENPFPFAYLILKYSRRDKGKCGGEHKMCRLKISRYRPFRFSGKERSTDKLLGYNFGSSVS
tara:strand:- start:777 stop:995 length:219 start_codon:yes stop_codon:yes gene_type:complete